MSKHCRYIGELQACVNMDAVELRNKRVHVELPSLQSSGASRQRSIKSAVNTMWSSNMPVCAPGKIFSVGSGCGRWSSRVRRGRPVKTATGAAFPRMWSLLSTPPGTW
jgi:hypothetical protein